VINRLIKMTLLTAPTECIVTPKGHRLRSQLNLLICSPFGSGKSSFMRTIQENDLGVMISRYTEAGIIGSITGKGDILPSGTILGAGKAVMIDEFQNVPPALRDCLLQLMEEHRADRTLGRAVSTPIEHVDKYWSVRAKMGWFEVYVRASYIICTMAIRAERVHDKALLSRCFPLLVSFSYADAKDLITGKRMLDLRDVKSKIELFDNKVTHLSEEGEKVLVDGLIRIASEEKMHPSYVPRAFGDICRIANVSCILDNRDEISGEDAELSLKFAPMYFASLKRAGLSYREFAVFDKIREKEKKRHKELLEDFPEFSERQIQEYVRKLKERKLVRAYKNGRETVYEAM